jgi:DNA-binding IclR family transcriptional regulator
MCAAQRDDPLNSVLGKAVAILEAFQHDDRGLTLGQLEQRTGIPKSTIHRLVRELIDHGVIETNSDGRFLPGLRLFELARLVPIATDLREAALPFIEDLYEATHETVHLGVLDDVEVVYIEKITGHRIAPGPTRVGGRMPAPCTGLGKAILAFSPAATIEHVLAQPIPPLTAYTITVPTVMREELTKIASDGIAYDREEARVGLACVAAPVFGIGGRVLAAISVSGPTSRTRPEQLAPAVRTAALGLSRTLRLAGVGPAGRASLPPAARSRR